MTEPNNRYAVQSVHMTTGEFEIAYYDRKTKHQHVAKGFTSLINPDVFHETLGPAFDRLIDAIREHPIQALGEPYPEAIIDADSTAS